MPVLTRKNTTFDINTKLTPFSNETKFSITLPKSIFGKCIALLFVLFLASPWLYMMVKNNALGGFTVKVADFYETTFSCQCPSANNTITTKALNKTREAEF